MLCTEIFCKMGNMLILTRFEYTNSILIKMASACPSMSMRILPQSPFNLPRNPCRPEQIFSYLRSGQRKCILIGNPIYRRYRMYDHCCYHRYVVISAIKSYFYREGHLVADMGWVGNDLDCSATLPCSYANTAGCSTDPAEPG